MNTKNSKQINEGKGRWGPAYSELDNVSGWLSLPMRTEPVYARANANISTETWLLPARGGNSVEGNWSLPTSNASKFAVRDEMASSSGGTSAPISSGSRTSASAKGRGKKHVSERRKLKSDRRMATKILQRYGGKNIKQESEEHASTLEWAKRVLSGREIKRARSREVQSARKRHRSHEEEASFSKNARTGPAPTFNENAKLFGPIELGVFDRSREDGAISREEWKRVAAAISAVFMKVVRRNPGPPPTCESAGWHYGLHKLIRCADERSAFIYKEAVARVGEIWQGARLAAVPKEDLPLRPRARVWLPAEPSSSEEIEEILRYCNPSLPTHDWRVIRLDYTQKPYRQVLLLLNKESLGALNHAKGVVSYGFEKVVLEILPWDDREDDPQTSGGGFVLGANLSLLEDENPSG
ncbi:uncharacterized protein LOC126760579 [Bactrocera neohumeralis]|uniref:uncharacterized protein LOC126760579 n=1 Tax=Bactrocera neohumeralis TaxID=98809 RepID=UPI0021652BBE|nr:uncharacterized protein LOC126760579 [Bactrocera neohumeralis]